MTKQYHGKKVALIGDCLSGGGAEKVLSLLSFYFENQGLEVHYCIFRNSISYDFAGTLLNLGEINPNSKSIFRKWHRFFAFRKFIKQTEFDLIIDFRLKSNFFFELIVTQWIYPKHTVFSIRSGILNYYLPNSLFLTTIIYKNSRFAVVSEAIKAVVLEKKLKHNPICIYNPIDFELVETKKNDVIEPIDNYVLAVGRMNEVKQFDELIVAYSKSNLPAGNCKLVVIGEGKEQSKYTELVAQLGLTDLVLFLGSVSNPFPYYKAAIFTLLCSKNEGFPNVLLESLAVETPVISFDCFSGPSEIIQNKCNGLLVENQNFEKLTEAMNQLYSDTDLYNLCKLNAKNSVAHFSIEKIGKQWLEFLKK